MQINIAACETCFYTKMFNLGSLRVTRRIESRLGFCDLFYRAPWILLKRVILITDFVCKVIQLYETTLVRNGLMLVGPTGSGKTKVSDNQCSR